MTQWKSGERVCALTPGGGYAQYCVTPAGQCLPVPQGSSMVEAASLPETFFTVWINVFERARLAPGETLLVQGGSSGIGVTAIQMARAFGHRVFATAGNASKCAACERSAPNAPLTTAPRLRRGGEAAYRRQGRGRILDMVGGDYVPRELKCLATDGRLSIIAFLGARSDAGHERHPMRRLTITGSTLRPRSVEYKTQIAQALREQVWPLIEDGPDQARHLSDVPARGGCGGARAHGVERACRQDRAGSRF